MNILIEKENGMVTAKLEGRLDTLRHYDEEPTVISAKYDADGYPARLVASSHFKGQKWQITIRPVWQVREIPASMLEKVRDQQMNEAYRYVSEVIIASGDHFTDEGDILCPGWYGKAGWFKLK